MFFAVVVLFFFKQKTAYEMRISDWSSDVCSSDLHPNRARTRISVRPGRAMSLRLRLVLTIGIALAVLWSVAAAWMLRDLDRNLQHTLEIGSASCRERVCQSV